MAFYRRIAVQVLGPVPDRTSSANNAEREAGLIRLLIDLRAEARKRKDFATGDSIRARLSDLGVALEDGKDGTSWKV